MSKFVGFIVGAALIAVGVLTGNVGLIIQGSVMIVTQAIVDLTMPKSPARQASEMSIALGEQPRVMQVGETFTPGSLVDGFNYGGKYGTDWECLVIRLADHKCHSLVGFYVNDEYNLYTADGLVDRYNGHLEIYFRNDTTNQALPSRVTEHGPGWTSADVGESGCDVVVCYKADKPDAKHPVWPGGRPRFGFVIKAKLCYDPRKDDTVPGGAGAHRWDDPATWEWSENAIICRYNWVRGVYANDDVTDQSKLLVGRGLTADEAPPENIFAAANLCDEINAASFPYHQIESALGTTAHFASNGVWMVRYTTGGPDTIEFWNLATKAALRTSTGFGLFTGDNVAVASDGTAYFAGQRTSGLSVFTSLWVVPTTGGFSRIDGSPGTGDWFCGPTRVFDTTVGRVVFTGTTAANSSDGYLDTGNRVSTPLYGNGRDACINAAGEVIGLFQPNGSSADMTFIRLSDMVVHTITGLVTRSAAGSPSICHVASESHYFVVSDGKFYLVDDATFVIKASGAFSAGTLNLPRNDAHRTSYWASYTEISLVDASTIRTVNPLTWVNEDSNGDEFFDKINNAIWTHPQFATHVTIRDLDHHGGYRVAGPIYANQTFLEVEEMFALATGGSIITHEGSVEVEPGQAKSIVATITDADLLTGSQVSWNQRFLSDSNSELVNTVVARYVEPTQKWNDHAAPAVRNTDDIIADGGPKEATLTMRLVRYQLQALRIAEINRRLGRLWGRVSVKLGPRFCELEDGDWVTWQSDRYLGGGSLTFRIEAYSIDEKWQVTLTLREIDAEVYADDAVSTWEPDQSEVTHSPPPPDIGAPDSGSWAVTATTLTSSNGNIVPALHVAGAATDDDSVEAIIVEYWKDDGVLDPVADPDSIPWTTATTLEPTATEYDITSVVGGSTYYVALTYVVSGISGDRLVLGPITVADVDVGGQITPLISAISWKQPVRAKTTAALAANTYANGSSGVGATLTGGANGALAAQDGVTMVATDRLLVANEATGSRNGVYVVSQVGDGSHPYILTRATDVDSAAKMVGATVKVSEGADAADQEWQCTTNAPIVVGTTALRWVPAVQSQYLAIETVAGAAYTFAAADNMKHKRFTNAGAITATVPKNATDPIPIGARIRATAAAAHPAGQVTLTPEDGTVSLRSRDGALKSAGQYSVFEIEKVGTNEWDVLGDVTT